MAALSLPQLSLNLPSTRVSVDFASFAVDLGAFPTTTAKPHNKAPLANKPLPALRNTTQHRAYALSHSLPEVKEEPELPANPPRQDKAKWSLRKTNSARTTRSDHSPLLSRTVSNASTASTTSTAVASVFSRAQSASTAHTSYSSSRRPSLSPLSSHPEELVSLSSLPLSLLEQILSYILDLPRTVSIGPMSMEHRHMQYRYNPASLEHIDLRQLLRNPIFLVSHRVRDIALDVFYRKCEFAIDLSSIYYTKVSSTINENLKKHIKFWNEPPTTVKETLRNLSKIQLRLPVPSTEAGVRRGRDEDNWMDGSDGKGGGSWRVKSMKREQEDALEIQKCLETIVKLIMTTRGSTNEPQGLTRSLSTLSTVRRTRSVKSERSKSAEYNRIRRGPSPDSENGEDLKRKPLKRMEVVLIKRSPRALVLSECLGLIRALRSVPVTGFTRYYLELNGQKFIWATKYRRKWQGMEPDGGRLLQDLQGLTVAETPIEPIRTPTEFKFVKVDKKGQLRLLDSALPKTPIMLETPEAPQKDVPPLPPPPAVPKTIRRKPVGKSIFKKRAHKRNDSFGFIMEQGMHEVGSSGTHTSGRTHPPTVDELRKIAEDIRNGLY